MYIMKKKNFFSKASLCITLFIIDTDIKQQNIMPKNILKNIKKLFNKSSKG
jgi:predicted small secreted protein